MPPSDESPPGAREVALFPLHSVLFPDGPLPLRIFETRYLDLVRRCMREEIGFGVLLILEGEEVAAAPAPPVVTAQVGTLAHVVDFHQLPDGLLGIVCRGGRRFRVGSRRQQGDGLYIGTVEWLADEPRTALPERHRPLGLLLERVLPELGSLYETIEPRFDDASWVGCRFAEILPLTAADKQMLLEIEDPVLRLDRLSPYIQRPGD